MEVSNKVKSARLLSLQGNSCCVIMSTFGIILELMGAMGRPSGRE